MPEKDNTQEILQKEIKSLKATNKKLQKELIELNKNTGSVIYTEAMVGLDYRIDDIKTIRLGLTGKVANSTPQDAHSQLFVELAKSLSELISSLMTKDEETKNES